MVLRRNTGVFRSFPPISAASPPTVPSPVSAFRTLRSDFSFQLSEFQPFSRPLPLDSRLLALEFCCGSAALGTSTAT